MLAETSQDLVLLDLGCHQFELGKSREYALRVSRFKVSTLGLKWKCRSHALHQDLKHVQVYMLLLQMQ